MCGMKRISGTYVKRPGWCFRIRTTDHPSRYPVVEEDVGLDRKTWEYRPGRSGRELKRVSKVSACGNIAKILQTNFQADKNGVWRSPAWLQCIRNASFWMGEAAMLDRTVERSDSCRACVKSGRKSNCHFDHALYGRSYLCR